VAIEIERKFLVRGDAWRGLARPIVIRQGYLAAGRGISVRIRMTDGRATLTVKGERAGMSREEFEYVIPEDDALAMLALCASPPMQKRRHEIAHAGKLWEVDEFLGPLAGLVIAEIELEREDEILELPDWVGEEVTDDLRYRNSSLIDAAAPPD
jgi:CYTH domain-containing protein